jgi:hypothetical protein
MSIFLSLSLYAFLLAQTTAKTVNGNRAKKKKEIKMVRFRICFCIPFSFPGHREATRRFSFK